MKSKFISMKNHRVILELFKINAKIELLSPSQIADSKMVQLSLNDKLSLTENNKSLAGVEKKTAA